MGGQDYMVTDSNSSQKVACPLFPFRFPDGPNHGSLHDRKLRETLCAVAETSRGVFYPTKLLQLTSDLTVFLFNKLQAILLKVWVKA